MINLGSPVAVIGAGTMGNGIAHVFAQHGFKVTLIDVSQPQLEKAVATIGKNLDRMVTKEIIRKELKEETLNNITTSNSIAEGVKNAALVVEAATENTELKLNIFRQADAAAPADCILATNTSSISITKIAAATNRPDSVIGMHFMNPVPVMKLVEIITADNTRPDITETIVSLSKVLGKTPCVVKDFPGFIANRILMPMINEAVYSLHEGVAGVEEIDTIMKLGMAHPMGPLQLADLIGLDVCLSIMKVLHEGFANDK
ncbi:MAG: 3-hydroxybutyryl-CoA dehydrogenase, partial [Chitinophagaceae bacterium]|nr:3-hydroxybutyryl-CoA dehydrogenase [Chitinophagaceae bacterium]